MGRQNSKIKDKFEDKYYTPTDVAKECVEFFDKTLADNNIDTSDCLYIEPSCGDGSFARHLKDPLCLDINPHYPGALTRDFLTWTPDNQNTPLLFIGNPPYGWGNKLSLNFFQRIFYMFKAQYPVKAVGFVLPAGFTQKHTVYAKKVAGMFKVLGHMPATRRFVLPDGNTHDLGAMTHFIVYKPITQREEGTASQNINMTWRLSRGTKQRPQYDPMFYDGDLYGIIKSYKLEDIGFHWKPQRFDPEGKKYVKQDIVVINSPDKKLIEFMRKFNWQDVANSYLDNSFGLNRSNIEEVLINNGFGIKENTLF